VSDAREKAIDALVELSCAGTSDRVGSKFKVQR